MLPLHAIVVLLVSPGKKVAKISETIQSKPRKQEKMAGALAFLASTEKWYGY